MVPGFLFASQNSARCRPVGPRLARKRGHINMCGDFATKSLERTRQSAISIANQLALYLGGKPGHCAMFRINAQPNSWCLVWAHGGRGNILYATCRRTPGSSFCLRKRTRRKRRWWRTSAAGQSRVTRHPHRRGCRRARFQHPPAPPGQGILENCPVSGILRLKWGPVPPIEWTQC